MVLSDSLYLDAHLDSLIRNDRTNGFLLASVDKKIKKDSAFHINYFQGPKFNFGKIRYDKTQNWLAGFLNYELKKLEGQKLAPAQIGKLAERILVDLENNGYPFAEVSFDSLQIQNNQLRAQLNVSRNHFVVIDSLKNIGKAKISTNYLYRYLDLKPGQPYDRRKIKNLKPKIQELSFVKLKEDPQISFIDQKAYVILNLNKSKSSHFDFIIGLLQNNSTSGQRYTMVLDFKAEMRNQLGYGERFFMQFQRLRPENQTIELAFDYPFILDSPFGTSFSFKQFRNEDKWIDRSIDIGGQYYLQGRDNIDVYWNNKVSSLITIDTLSLLNQQKLPSNLDNSYNGLGMSFYQERLNYRFNPNSGYELELGGEAGIKKIKPNNTIQSIADDVVDFSNSYDSLTLSTYQVSLHLKAAYFQPINRSITIKTSIDAAYKFNEDRLFENDLFRIGGNRILRGFDEQSILSSFYTVLTAELRFILAQQDNNFTLSLPFIDYGFEYNPLRAVGEEKWDRPIGVGVGMNFQTKAGIFSFAMAVGKRRGNSFDFANLKIHFGYVNLF